MSKLIARWKRLEPHYRVLIGVKAGVGTGLGVVHFAPLPPEWQTVVSFLANIVWLFVF